jgi:hypothetical protein
MHNVCATRFQAAYKTFPSMHTPASHLFSMQYMVPQLVYVVIPIAMKATRFINLKWLSNA